MAFVLNKLADMENIYEAAKKVYAHEITTELAVKELMTKTEAKAASLRMYFNIYACMRKGKCYKHGTSEKFTKFLLGQIYIEFGKEAFETAVSAAKLHSEYRASVNNAQPGITKVCREVIAEKGVDLDYDSLPSFLATKETVTASDKTLHNFNNEQRYVTERNRDRFGKFDSWEIIDENTAIKHCDKSFFDYNGSGVPKEICWFFGAEDLEQGVKIQISLIYDEKQFDGRILIEPSYNQRARIFWGSDLGKLFAEKRNVAGVATFKKVAANTYAVHLSDVNEVDFDNHSGYSVSKGGEEELPVKDIVVQISNYIVAKGFNYEDGLIENFYLSLKSKPFVILAGISGTGKTRLVKLFAEAIGATAQNGRYKMVSVRPDWSDSSDLFGHVDLNGRFVPGAIIDYVKQAEQDISRPYFLCLDEMNLARVEYYLSDILSVIETRDFHNSIIETAPLISDIYYGADAAAREKYGEVKLPENLYIIGTVNMDETTFPFSRKVLDRANTIEFSYVDLMPQWTSPLAPVNAQNLPNSFLKTEYLLLAQCADEIEAVGEYCSELQDINQILQKANAHVGYRVRDEIIFYLLNNKKADLMSEDEAMDHEIMQKILPRIQGSSAAIKDMLCELFKHCAGDYSGYHTEDDDVSAKMLTAAQHPNCKYKKSAEKIAFMVRRYEEDGFTSYWL